MSTGPFLTGIAAAVVLSMGVAAAGASDDKAKGKHGSHEVGSSVYTATFSSHGPLCSASGSPRASSVALNSSPFASFHGSGAYSSLFFGSNASGGIGGGASAYGGGSGSTAARGSTSANGHQGNSGNTRQVVSTPAAPGRSSTGAAAAVTFAVTTATPTQNLMPLKNTSPAATPEPATLLLLTSGLGGLLVSRRRRNGSR